MNSAKKLLNSFSDILKSKITLNVFTVVSIVVISALIGASTHNYLIVSKIKNSLVNQGYSIEELAESLKSIKGSVGAKGNDDATAKELTDLVRSIAGKSISSNKGLAPSENDIYYASGHASPTVPNSLGILKTIDDTNANISVYELPEEDETKVVSTLLSGELIFYYQHENGWYQVEYKPFKLGWVKDMYLNTRD